jgi:hypothetical protein
VSLGAKVISPNGLRPMAEQVESAPKMRPKTVA